MNPLNKTQAIIIGLLALVLTLILGSVLIDSNSRYEKIKAENEARLNATPAMVVDPEPEFDVELTCPEYRNTVAMSKYEDVPGACFEYFHITDAMLEARFKAMYPYENPCSN